MKQYYLNTIIYLAFIEHSIKIKPTRNTGNHPGDEKHYFNLINQYIKQTDPIMTALMGEI